MATIIYLITDHATQTHLQALTDRLISQYDPVPLPRWTLEHRLFRSIPHPSEDKTHPRFLHFLTSSYLSPERTYVTISPTRSIPAETGQQGHENQHKLQANDHSTIAIPTTQTDSHRGLLETSFGALWMPRLTLLINNGAAFDLGDYTVRLAEVRQADAQHSLRAVAVCIDALVPNLSGGAEGAGDAGGVPEHQLSNDEVVKMMIRELWKTFGVENAREITVPSGGGGRESEKMKIAQLWGEALLGR